MAKMTLVNLTDIFEIEFGVRLKNGDDFQNFLIPIANPLRSHFREMLTTTINQFPNSIADVETYDPAQIYSGDVTLQIPLTSNLVEIIRMFFFMENIPIDATKVEENQNVVAYFCIFRHTDGQKTIGIRRANQFKIVTNQKLISLCDDTLEFVTGKLFKLDYVFDFIVTQERIFIRRISGFEVISQLNDVILQSAQQNTVALGERLTWIDIDRLEQFVGTHMRSAKLIASIISRDNLELMTQDLLRSECERDGVIIEENNGKISPAERSEFGFLNVLDRRRYHIQLIPNVYEIYEAQNRRGVE
jgi:hypothetical protein